MKSFLRYHIKDRLTLAYKWNQLLLSNEFPILVFTMAKVGSLSVYTSIKKSSKNPCFHIHSLSAEEIKKSNQLCFDAKIFPDSRSPAKLIYDKIIRKGRPYLVISLFRNPVERMFSAFFDAFKLINGVEPFEYKGSVSDLIQSFNKWVNFSYTLNWYENQFLESTGINVYSHPFDKSKKYSVIENKYSKTLLMNSEIDDSIKTDVIGEFTGIKKFQLTNINITSQSSSSELYKDFKKNIRLEKNLLIPVLDSLYFNHFFTNQEREETISNWAK